MKNPSPRSTPGDEPEDPAPTRSGLHLNWTSLVLAAAVLGVILSAGVPVTRGLSAWVERRSNALRDRPGPGDAYTYFFDDHEQERRLYSALYFPAHHGEDLDPELLAQRIVGLGPDVIPVLLSVLCGDLRLTPGSPPSGLDLAPLDARRIIPNQDVLLLDALCRFEPGNVIEQLDRSVSADAEIGRRLIAARVLGGLRDPRALDSLLRILDGTEALQFDRPHVRAHFEAAISSTLERYPAALVGLPRELENLQPAALPLIVNAVPLAPQGSGLQLILELLERNPALAPEVLRRISEVAKSLHGGVLDDTLWQLHWLIDSSDWEVRRGVAVALGHLQDPNSCPQLIRMLEDPERRVSRGALWALREMSGRNFGADQELWLGWYEAERTWFEGPCVALEEGLQSEDPAEVIRSIGLLCHRPLFRNHMAEALGPLLWHDDLNLVQAVCPALEQLGSQRAVPFLVERLADRPDQATQAVRVTLRSLTGLDLPPEQEAWHAALGL